MYNLIVYTIFLFLFISLVIVFTVQKAECYEYDNLGMYTVKDEIVGIREYNGKFFIYVINKENNQGYAKECIDFHEAFTIQQRLLKLRKDL